MIYTIGYTGIRLAQIQALLDAHQALLVDIRYNPDSRNPVYKQPALQAVLSDRYVHVVELGNRNYKGGPIDIVDLPAGIRVVQALLQRVPAVVLMCVCADRPRCHRQPVGEAMIQELACPVEHVELRASKSRQLTLGL